MSFEEHDIVKCYLDSYFAKRFILASLAPYYSIFSIKKLVGIIPFSVDYQIWNTITKKDWYSIFLIEKTLAQLEDAKYLTKRDIQQVFYSIMMSKNSKKLITFLTGFDAFNYFVMLLDFANDY